MKRVLVLQASAVAMMLCLVVLISIPGTEASTLGVSKAIMDFRNVLKNGYAQDSLFASTDSPENLSLIYEFSGAIAPWARILEEGNLSISRDHGQWLTVALSPPPDVQNGIYKGLLRVKTGPMPRPEDGGRLGTSVAASFAILMSVEIVGQETLTCIAGGYKLPDIELGNPVELGLFVQNTGNVMIRPVALITIWDQNQENLLATQEVPLTDQVLPTTNKRYHAQVPELNLGLGQYWAHLSVPMCSDETELFTFNVLERGGISDKGILVRIDNPFVVNTSDIVPIQAVFKNIGERLVSAKFKGVITKDQAVVKVIDTDYIDVEPDELANIETFFQPEKPGTYEIKGRVLYNNKLTFEKQSVLHVNPSEDYSTSQSRRITLISYLQLFLLLAAIIFLIIIIRRKRRRKKKHSDHRIL